MSLFCLLCIPLLYFLRRRPSGGGESIWGLPLGAVAVVVQYFVGPLVTPGAFGFPRWMSGFVDIVGLPALLPLIVCGALAALRAFPRDADYAGFALLWLIPLAAIRSMSNSPPSPLPLIVVPLLWSAQAVGIPFFIGCILKKPRWYIIIPSVLGIAALPIAATTSWWMFFSHQNFLGVLLLLLSVIPGVISILGSREWGVGSGDRCSNYDIASEPYPDNSNNTPHSL
jgi:hypothetical protein